MASLRPLCFNSIRSPKRFILTPFHQFRNSRVPLQLQRCYRVDSNNRHELGFPSESKQQYQRFRKAQPPFYQSQRFWITMGTGGGLIGGYYVTHLETVPVTDRRRFIDVTLEQEEDRQQGVIQRNTKSAPIIDCNSLSDVPLTSRYYKLAIRIAITFSPHYKRC
ncbi:hypothetical protein BC937DRAFT_88997 [Endogone sp. FLAS-F59071]|nr:hypothetical protein BC937DRAFT_88997 [Endogone sp. FLAS-F59071]|eukprot:RUS18248.1 hypothetical protein BC937DRAFT_88997 [Endogone sp. FLAS-F59071]